MQRKQKEDIGLSPYEMKFRGSKKEKETRISLFSFNSEEVDEKQLKHLDELSRMSTKTIILRGLM